MSRLIVVHCGYCPFYYVDDDECAHPSLSDPLPLDEVDVWCGEIPEQCPLGDSPTTVEIDQKSLEQRSDGWVYDSSARTKEVASSILSDLSVLGAWMSRALSDWVRRF